MMIFEDNYLNSQSVLPMVIEILQQNYFNPGLPKKYFMQVRTRYLRKIKCTYVDVWLDFFATSVLEREFNFNLMMSLVCSNLN